MAVQIIQDRYIDEKKLHSKLMARFGRGKYKVQVWSPIHNIKSVFLQALIPGTVQVEQVARRDTRNARRSQSKNPH